MTAQQIADAIEVNCLEHLTGAKSRGEWDREQHRLWTLAREAGLGAVVARLVAPQVCGVGR